MKNKGSKRFWLLFSAIYIVSSVLIFISWSYPSDIITVSVTLIIGGFLLYMLMRGLYSLFRFIFSPLSRTYRVKKGRHYSGFRFKPFLFSKSGKYEVDVTIWRGWYDINEYGDHMNKICGKGKINHHEESYRFGLRPNKTKGLWDVYTYDYINGELQPHYLLKTLREKKKTRLMRYLPKIVLGKHLFLYSGGENKPAPTELSVDVFFR